MEEVWTEINESDLYELSNYGNIRNKYTKIIKSCHTTKNGIYDSVSFNSKHYYIHRLVAKYFVDNPNPKLYNVVNHLDENTHNNRFDNLEWTTNRDNLAYSNVGERKAISYSKGKVIQYDKDGNIVKVWNSAKAVYNNGYTGAYTAVSNNTFNRFFKNYFWFKEDEKFDNKRIKTKYNITLIKDGNIIFKGSAVKACRFLKLDCSKFYKIIKTYRYEIDNTDYLIYNNEGYPFIIKISDVTF